jgi:signal transduction histidine kinase
MLWFALGSILTLSAFALATYLHLDRELRLKQVALEYPTHPDWKLHGSVRDTGEILDIMVELAEAGAVYALPLLAVTLLLGYRLAGLSLRPIADLNRQLARIESSNLADPLHLREADREFDGLIKHLNALLQRLHRSFADLRDFTAHVAHELRTPLAIMRLKLERAETSVDPDLAEELQAELHRLSRLVDQALLVAQAEQGRLQWTPREFDLRDLLEEYLRDFDVLAEDEHRRIVRLLHGQAHVYADPHYLKQILYVLLSNALKHGEGDVRVRLSCLEGHARVLIVNPTRRGGSSTLAHRTLGLGLRLARALLQFQTTISLRHHSGSRGHAARLSIPLAPSVQHGLSDAPGLPKPAASR